MATGTITSSVGLASGLDTSSIISGLMNVEKRPILLLQQKEAGLQAKLSSLGQLKGALSAFQSAASALDSRTEFAAFKASVADTSVASSAASFTAAAGSYSLEVTQLASAQKVITQSRPDGFTLTDGTLTFYPPGADPVSIEVSAANGNNTLAGLKDAVNAANAGVTATLINDGSGTRLAFTSVKTGTAEAVAMRGLGMDFGAVSGTPVADASGIDASASSDAKNAIFKLDNVEITKPSNVVSDALTGVTLTLSKTNIGNPTTLQISSDAATIQGKVSSFVKAFNDLQSVIAAQTSYNSETKVAGALNGDATVRSIQGQMRSLLSSAVPGEGMSFLSEAGISFQTDGTLAFDTKKFQAALEDPAKDVARLFVKDSSGTGIASLVNTRIGEILGENGLLSSRTDSINNTIKGMDKRIESLADRLVSIEARYRTQFNALEQTLSSLNSTGNYLTQQLDALSNFYKSSR